MSRRRPADRRPSLTDLFDPRFYAQGLGYGQPSPERMTLADLLDFLGDDEDERVETATALLRRSSAEERVQLTTVIQRALAAVAADGG